MTPLTPEPIASPRWCSPFAGRFATGTRTRRPPSSRHGHGDGGCGWPLDRVAGWVGGGIAAVFFASLERCSCVNVRTQDDDLVDDEQRDSEAPLMFHDANGNGCSLAAAAAGVRRKRGGSRGGSEGKGKRSGGGMGDYGLV
ncbi:hypothetical protein ACP70R_024719 [Stipagrostis hirtigluma subsp. patula]